MIDIDAKDCTIRRACAGLMGDRTLRTLSLALILIVAMGSLRPDKPRGVYPKRYWAEKISWHHCADIVVAGDSRVLGGVSPAEMRNMLTHCRILNYGFASNLYVPEYLEAVEQVLDPDSSVKVILLGITPRSLTADPDVTYQFSTLKGTSRRQLYMDMCLAPLLSFLEYMSFRDALQGLIPSLDQTRTRRELFADGWLSYSRQPPGEKKELKTYYRIYQKNRVSPEMVEVLNRFVSRWTQTGIRVYGFVMPTCREMVELEEHYSGFDHRQFVDGFEEAGGIWIDTDPDEYESFDGSHLQSHAALRFSQDLAQRLYALERDKLNE